MPHIIVEYPGKLSEQLDIPEILNKIHDCVSGSGLFEASHIKTRAYAFKEYTKAGGNDPYIHI
ncbi:MAG: 5-carboxymethyl-2-hydroxymuconate isomerase, partial [Gammaproteobacteria bacterium]|nr:5-carboxymethyl-2-hydroxymuconate isomerase [Gammaproteobacteria bacterium]